MKGPPLPPVVIDAKLGSGPIQLERWRAWVRVYGPICSRWLVGERFRAGVRCAGGFDVFVPRTVSLSIQSAEWRWFKLAVADLRRRPTWRVREVRRVDGTTYEFRWLLHSASRERPDVARVLEFRRRRGQ